MKYFVSERNHEKYRPQATFRQRVFSKLKKQKQVSEQRLVENARHQPTSFKNPYHQKQPGLLRRRIWLSIFLLIMLSWIGLVLYLPYFQINKVTASGLKITKDGDVISFLTNKYLNRTGILPRGNYFFIPADKISTDLTKEFTLERVVLKKIFPNEIHLDITEKVSTIIYDDGKNYYLLDQNGRIIRMLIPVAENELELKNQVISITTSTVSSTYFSTTTTPSSTAVWIHTPNYSKIKSNFGPLPLLYDLRANTTSVGNQIVLPSSLVQSVIDMAKEVEKQGIGQIKYCTIENPLGGVRVITENGWDFYFDPNANIISQINNLKSIIKTNHPKEYIDLRYGNRVYWR